MRTAMSKPRMGDVARRAGVSIGTVSRVLNGKTDVATELVARVQQAAEELGYRRRIGSHPGDATGRDFGTIGYLVDAPNYSGVATDPFQRGFLSGIEQGMAGVGGQVIVATVKNEIERDQIPTMVTERLVRGVIVKSGNSATDAWLQKVDQMVPLVTINHPSVYRQFPSVMCDNFGGMFQVLRYLRDLGHTRFGLIYEDEAGAPVSVHHLEREEAFLKYAPQFGCADPLAYVQKPVRQEGEGVEDVVATALRNFMQMGERRPTAIVATADVYAFCILRLASSFGLTIPEDMSVASFMNTEACDYSNPPLTSVSLSGEEIGAASADLLVARVRNPDALPRHVIVNTTLVRRGSCAKPREQVSSGS